jgi:hypothetical protein
MGVIELLPGDRIRLKVARDFDWLPDGPIWRFFVGQGLSDFLDSGFDQPGQTLDFTHGMLTGSAEAEFFCGAASASGQAGSASHRILDGPAAPATRRWCRAGDARVGTTGIQCDAAQHHRLI